MLVFIFVTFFSLKISKGERDYFIVWNVGQGSWSTYISTQFCFHFDMGGEFMVRAPRLKKCSAKSNILFLSHFDWDHTSFILKYQRNVRSFCAAGWPLALNAKKKTAHNLTSKVKNCESKNLGINKIARELSLNKNEIEKKSLLQNDLSRIFMLRKKWLIPGDSTKEAEKVWSKKLAPTIETLLLAHHGSRTSTSDDLLMHLPRLLLAVASSRYKKYGHPHSEVILRLKKRKTPLLTTEKWGHIIFEM